MTTNHYFDPKLKIFALNSNRPLAEKIADQTSGRFVESILRLHFVGKLSVDRFSDGEIQINIEESVRGDNVYVIQSTSAPVNDNLMELLIMVDALRRASAKTINVVIPYYGYARQDRKARSREPITAKLVANMLQNSGVDRVIALDLHAAQIQGFFDIPVDHLMGAPLLAEYFIKEGVAKDAVVISPDHGGVTRARALAEFLKSPIAIIDKRRPKPNVAVAMNLLGDVNGKVAVIIDDMVDTAGTLVSGIDMLKAKGATAVYACCTHGILSGPAIERLKNAGLAGFICTNTIDQTEKQKEYPEMVVLSVAPLIAAVISAVEHNSSMSDALSHAFE